MNCNWQAIIEKSSLQNFAVFIVFSMLREEKKKKQFARSKRGNFNFIVQDQGRHDCRLEDILFSHSIYSSLTLMTELLMAWGVYVVIHDTRLSFCLIFLKVNIRIVYYYA
jgi:hypothetical protein